MKNILKMFAGVVSVLTVFSGMDANAMQQQPTAFGYTVFGPQQVAFVEQLIAGDFNQAARPDNFAWQLNRVGNIGGGYFLSATCSNGDRYNNFQVSLRVFEIADGDGDGYHYAVFVANNRLDEDSWGFQSVLNELAAFSN